MTCKINKSQKHKRRNNKTKKGGKRRVEKIYINLGRQHTNPDIRGDIRIKSGPTTYDADSRMAFLSNFFEHAAKSFEEDLAVISMGEPKSTEKQKVYKVVFYDNDEPLQEGSENPIKCKKKKDGKDSKEGKDSKKKRKSEKKGGVKCGQKKRKTRRIGGNPTDHDPPSPPPSQQRFALNDDGLDATDEANARAFENEQKRLNIANLKKKITGKKGRSKTNTSELDFVTGYSEERMPEESPPTFSSANSALKALIKSKTRNK